MANAAGLKVELELERARSTEEVAALREELAALRRAEKKKAATGSREQPSSLLTSAGLRSEGASLVTGT